MIYNNELYLNVLKENCKIYDKLSIISDMLQHLFRTNYRRISI